MPPLVMRYVASASGISGLSTCAEIESIRYAVSSELDREAHNLGDALFSSTLAERDPRRRRMS